MSEPINHHYVPQFYLAKWARGDGRVARYHRPHSKVEVSWRTPKHLGYEERLYTLEGYPAERQQSIETSFFKPLDDAAAPIWTHLINHGPADLDDAGRSEWTRFIMSLQHRNPHALGEIRAMIDPIIRQNIEAQAGQYELTREEGDPETVFDFAMQESPELILNAYKSILPEMIDHPQIGQWTVQMHWAVLDLSDAGLSVLTCDRPFTSSHGYGDMRLIIGVPISPTHIFVAVRDPAVLLTLRAQRPRDTVRNANRLFVSLAVENVYGADENHKQFVENRLRQAGDPIAPGVIAQGMTN